MIIGYH